MLSIVSNWSLLWKCSHRFGGGIKESMSVYDIVMSDINRLFFNLICLTVGSADRLSRIPTDKEWKQLYNLAKKQSLVGVCFAALQRLGADADDGFARVGMNEMLYLTWMGMAAKIQQRNQIVDGQCVTLQKKLAENGFRSCVLKGQGVGLLYAEHLRGLRQSGDIDVWMDGGFEKVNAWVQKVAPTKVVNQHHVDLKIFDGTEVEAHYHPINMTNPLRQKRLKKFISDHEDECLTDTVDNTIHVPTNEFNLVFLMIHIFHHLFTEGVGLRQVMDYYFVLQAYNESQESKEEVVRVVQELGLERFASALMFVMQTVFGMDEQLMLWKPNAKDGKFLLDEIMISGNFGKQDDRQKGLYESKWNSFWMVNGKTFRFWRFDHWAWFWSPIERIKGYAWRRMHGYRQY